MTVEQIIEIPADRRIALEVPRTVPVGKTILSFTPVSGGEPRPSTSVTGSVSQTKEKLKIEDVRQLLRKEMMEKGTLAVTAVSGDGWTAHVMEHYAEKIVH